MPRITTRRCSLYETAIPGTAQARQKHSRCRRPCSGTLSLLSPSVLHRASTTCFCHAARIDGSSRSTRLDCTWQSLDCFKRLLPHLSAHFQARFRDSPTTATTPCSGGDSEDGSNNKERNAVQLHRYLHRRDKCFRCCTKTTMRTKRIELQKVI